jgi:hypothetical protein
MSSILYNPDNIPAMPLNDAHSGGFFYLERFQ